MYTLTAAVRESCSPQCSILAHYILSANASHPHTKMAEGVVPQKSPISRLQEVCQQWKFSLPTYREAQGTFQEFGTEVSLSVEGESVTFYGRGRTKKLSKANAAQELLEYISQTRPHLLEPPPLAVSPVQA